MTFPTKSMEYFFLFWMENIRELYSRKQNLNSFSTTKINKLCIYLEKALYKRKKIFIFGKKTIICNFKAGGRRCSVECLSQSITNHGTNGWRSTSSGQREEVDPAADFLVSDSDGFFLWGTKLFKGSEDSVFKLPDSIFFVQHQRLHQDISSCDQFLSAGEWIGIRCVHDWTHRIKSTQSWGCGGCWKR